MATKTTFTPEEWDLLMTGVMSSGVAVTAADPSGLWGLMKESLQAPGRWSKPRPTRSRAT